MYKAVLILHTSSRIYESYEIYCLIQLADQRNSNSQWKVGKLFEKEGKYDSAMEYYLKASDQEM